MEVNSVDMSLTSQWFNRCVVVDMQHQWSKVWRLTLMSPYMEPLGLTSPDREYVLQEQLESLAVSRSHRLRSAWRSLHIKWLMLVQRRALSDLCLTRMLDCSQRCVSRLGVCGPVLGLAVDALGPAGWAGATASVRNSIASCPFTLHLTGCRVHWLHHGWWGERR